MRESLGEGENRSFRNAVDKLITAFENPLFASLLGNDEYSFPHLNVDVQEYYESLLGVDSNYSKLSGSGSKTSQIHELYALFFPQFASSSHVDGSTVSPARTASSDRRSSDEPTLVQPEWEYLEVILKRDADTLGGFGFSIAGGIDAPLSDMDSGIYVTRINANGVADLDGRLRVDDQILAVNGISLEHVTNAEAVQTLRRGGNSLHLVSYAVCGA
ncbi:PSD-95 alpha [Fasciola hepatica]|uniref:PSD-95 alpha n=1 Tax=Fasciola hepatica TaxID=6192 RepID=A0A4E0RKZ4_FASHE|nr:PSD-95 alpha [Fasciola hepatica]